MAQKEYIYRTCGQCDGDGVEVHPSPIPPNQAEERPCASCGGTGGILWGWVEKVT